MPLLRVAALIFALAALSGCAAFALAVGSVVGGAGVDHTMSGIAFKTFSAPMKNVRTATLKTLKKMDMEVKDDRAAENGWEIAAAAYDREIGIELEALTARATRMRVVVSKGEIFFKDAATGTEIIIQTAEALGQQRAAR